MARSSVSFSFLMSSEERSTGGTVISVTRNTIHSLPPEPGVCPTPSFAARNAAAIAPEGTPGGEASRLKPAAISTFDPVLAASSASLPPCSSFCTISVALARNRPEIWSSRHLAST